ncbi:type II toxin-antitoxin system Phd/YefM family antitoxin [Streptoalloteichus hindustanus]|uniref:Antitoxin Phd_YefM, type II toxin-antitoxin system n=1 Tax=Streptoalloteichus hindustanus TaxID=2017 RepID=A0A1M5HGK8_STRHI|nr:type II toxin-antitoxin system Phd/YefM family antitoxin [Streptoalloteichus hindustanus]SHG15057.1 Antitoxin Phd_YefM, type II toxin-antitoxin system [Streptoalloteichus hindustanus]
MKVISQRELRDNFAAILEAVNLGETYRITRDGVGIAEFVRCPIGHA